MDDKNFDKISALEWSQAIESKGAINREKDFYPKINSWMDEFSLRKMLDVGCGQGICASKLNLIDREYKGVDPSPFLIDRAKSLYPDFKQHFILGNVYNLPFSNNSFDAAFSIAVWHLLEDIEKANLELNRILKPKGKFLIITANKNFYKDWISAYDKVETRGKETLGMKVQGNDFKIQDKLFLRSHEEINKSLNSAGLRITSAESIRIWTLIKGVKE